MKTKSYFGPDRRRGVNPNYTGPERRKGDDSTEVIKPRALIEKAKAR